MKKDMESKGEKKLPYTTSDSVLAMTSVFKEKGGWSFDQQFLLQMGSSYLLAHGLGIPVADAWTEVNFPSDGKYNVYVRTRNWIAYWSEEETPGQFQVKIDDVMLNKNFGTENPEWGWEKGGSIEVKSGKHRVALHDLTGFDGRCDAILFSKSDVVPDNSLETVFALRETLLGLPGKPDDRGKFDFVVVGGGIAGICAAIAAARLGIKVALIQDRFVLGGNNSSEIRVGMGGQINVDPFPALGYLLNEICPDKMGNSRGPEHYQDEKKMTAILAEKNITLFLGYMVTSIEKDSKNNIKSVIGTQVETLKQIKVEGDLFSDCTGDATLGVLAGAEWRMGRESKSEFGEPQAPEEPDSFTMGCSIMWYCLDSSDAKPFPDITWGLKINEYTVQKVRRGQWYWEVGMRDDQIEEAERIRDYGMYVAYSNWSYLKNRFSQKNEYENSYLSWVSFISGKRESRRIMGDLVLREQDVRTPVIYPDKTVTCTWWIDQHYPEENNSKYYPGQEWLSVGKLDPIDFYPLPYRCLYSKDINNMFMAGRNISVTHLALGTVRVMRTTGMMGEVVGMAAAICVKKKCLARDIYTKYFDDLVVLMKKGVGRTDVPYTQYYCQIERVGKWGENC